MYMSKSERSKRKLDEAVDNIIAAGKELEQSDLTTNTKFQIAWTLWLNLRELENFRIPD